MEKTNDSDPRIFENSQKFDSVTKISVPSVTIVKGSRGKRNLSPPVLKSPDELNPKWVTDPQDISKAKKAASKEANKSNKET